jgi:hypothetical protein
MRPLSVSSAQGLTLSVASSVDRFNADPLRSAQSLSPTLSGQEADIDDEGDVDCGDDALPPDTGMGRVRVFVRVRPMQTNSEVETGESSIVSVNPDNQQVILNVMLDLRIRLYSKTRSISPFVLTTCFRRRPETTRYPLMYQAIE